MLISFTRLEIGNMICALPIGVLVLLASFIALRIAVGKHMPEKQGQHEVNNENTKELNCGIVALLVFLVIYLVVLLRSK